MADSAAERPVLTDQQTQELNYIKLTWDRFYDITCDGTRWFAVPKGTKDVLKADTKQEMQRLISLDAPQRSVGGHYVESASGPPYWLADHDRPARASRAC